MENVSTAPVEERNNDLLSVSNLCTQRNLSSTIFHLPSETLADIFTHVAHDYHESKNRALFCVPRWVDVSYVCQHWRDVALSCPTLWTYHFIVSLRWTEELLARSKQASLKIRIEHDSRRTGSWWSNLVGKILNHAERIEELRMHIPAPLFPPKLSLHAPRLQILDIYIWINWFSAIDYGDMDIPLLHTLKLTSCPLPLLSTNLSRVTTLVVCHVPAPSKRNLVEFLVTLGRMQALAVLHLEDALSGVLSSETLCVSPKVNLPCLARLFIVAPFSTTVALLSCINIPFKTQVGLEIPEDGTSVNDFTQLSVQRFNQFEDMMSFGPKIRSLKVCSSPDDSTVAVSASEHSDCNSHLSMACTPRECNVPLMILVRMNPSVFLRNWCRIASDICCSIPSDHVEALHVINPPSLPRFWRKTLGHLCGLRSMRLSDGCMPKLVSLLAFAADGPPETLKGHVTSDGSLTRDRGFIPVLEELELCQIRFGFMDEGSSSQKSLLDALSTRKDRQPRLTMIECGDVEENEVEHDANPPYAPSWDQLIGAL